MCTDYTRLGFNGRCVRVRVISINELSGSCQSCGRSEGEDHTHMSEGELFGVDESRLVVFDLNVLYRIMKEKIMNIW
jgi:hypothetical protein